MSWHSDSKSYDLLVSLQTGRFRMIGAHEPHVKKEKNIKTPINLIASPFEYFIEAKSLSCDSMTEIKPNNTRSKFNVTKSTPDSKINCARLRMYANECEMRIKME